MKFISVVGNGEDQEWSFVNTSINRIPLQRLPIQNPLNLKNEEIRLKTDAEITHGFVKKPSLPNLDNSLGYIKCDSSNSPRPVKNLSQEI